MNSEELTAEMARVTGKEVILMFSMGKESIACYYQLKKHFEKVHLVYKYLHPNLSFIQDSIHYFEDKWGEKIHQIPSPALYRMINEYIYQTPETVDIIDGLNLPNHKHEHYDEWLPQDLNCPNAFRAIGVRASDSPTRAMVIRKFGSVNFKKRHFYPIFDWNIEDLKNCLRDNNVKLPVDYEMWGKSFDGIDYRFIKPLKERFPADYEKLKELFPLLDLEVMRYEQIWYYPAGG